MNKKLIILVLCLIDFCVLSQNYIPFPENDAVWIQASYLYYGYNHEHATITESLSFLDDSTHNMTNYRTLSGNRIAEWIDGWGSQQNYQTGIDYLLQDTILIRQDIPQKQVFIWSNLENQEALLYDFSNLAVGQPYPQTYTNVSYPQLLIMAHDSVMLNDGLYHEKWVLGTNSNDSGFVSVIEGVGSTMGFDLPMTIPFEQSSATLCFSVNESAVYDAWIDQPGLIPAQFSEDCKANLSTVSGKNITMQIEVYPNPIGNDYFSVNATENIRELKIYDILGRIVYESVKLNKPDINIPGTNFDNGTYTISIETESGKMISSKIIK